MGMLSRKLVIEVLYSRVNVDDASVWFSTDKHLLHLEY